MESAATSVPQVIGRISGAAICNKTAIGIRRPPNLFAPGLKVRIGFQSAFRRIPTTAVAMNQLSSEVITKALAGVSEDNPVDAQELMPLVYDQLRALANTMLQNENPGSTLQPTALVNEAYLKLVDQSRVDWKGKSHFFAIGATIMRRILVDHARAKHRKKRGGGWQRIELQDAVGLRIGRDEDVLAVNEALEKLTDLDPVQAKIVEMRFFAGMTVAEVAEVLSLSKRKVEYEWEMIRAWLRRELGDEGQQ